MPANRTTRPAPGTTLVLPRVTDAESTQRAIDQIASVIRQVQAGLELFEDDRNGRVPASGGGAVKFLRADRTWAVPAGGGGGGVVTDGDYGDVVVTAAGTVWTVDALPQSRISGLVADLAAKVPSSRTITTTAPMTINGGASADLSANVTLATGSFGTAASGIVTASGGATRFLIGDNTWITLAQLLSLLNIGLGQFGDGSDGAATMDGSTAVAGCTRTGSVYVADRNTFFTTLVIDSGITFKPSGYPVNVLTLLTNNGLITGSGGDAAVSVGGVPSWTATTPLPGGFAGVSGGSSGGGSANACPQDFSIAAALGGAAGSPPVVGASGGVGHGGGGGGSWSTVGGDGGVVAVKLATSGNYRQYLAATTARDGKFVAFTCGSPGGAGANAFGIGLGGGSGASGGWVVVSAFAFAGSGLYQSHGGAGGPGAIGTATNGGGAGGGAGGSGGLFALVGGSGSAPTPTVTGGAAGPGGAIGTGAQPGANGGPGGDGRTVIFV